MSELLHNFGINGKMLLVQAVNFFILLALLSKFAYRPILLTDKASIATGAGKGAVAEIKEWQAILDHLRGLPVKTKGDLPVIPGDERAAEVRAIKAG